MKSGGKIARIPTSYDRFFELWCEFLRPLHNLTNKQIKVVAAFLKERYELSKKIKDEDILDKVTMSEDIKRKVRESCNMTTSHFMVVMGKLRKSKIIVNGKISPKLIPTLEEDESSSQLLLFFDLQNG